MQHSLEDLKRLILSPDTTLKIKEIALGMFYTRAQIDYAEAQVLRSLEAA